MSADRAGTPAGDGKAAPARGDDAVQARRREAIRRIATAAAAPAVIATVAGHARPARAE
jgi:hypothetical protein